MDIQWHGLSCFTIKGKEGTIVTDPYDAKAAGLKAPSLKADIVLANSDFPLHHAIDQFGKETCIFDWPGEYESKGIIVQCIPAFDRPKEKEEGKKDQANKVNLFVMEIDGFTVCHLSNLGHKLLPEMVEVMGDVDVLLLPVGGVGCLNAEKAHEVLEQIDPRIVIPMYYKIPGLKLELDELGKFLKEVGLHAPASEGILKLQNQAGLPQEHTEFKILEPTF